MKVVALILSVYIIFLTAKPCDDAVTVNSGNYITLSAEQPVHAHDMCSPFCICQCCQAHFQVTSGVLFNFNYDFTDQYDQYFLFNFISLPSEFFIPPEIV